MSDRPLSAASPESGAAAAGETPDAATPEDASTAVPFSEDDTTLLGESARQMSDASTVPPEGLPDPLRGPAAAVEADESSDSALGFSRGIEAGPALPPRADSWDRECSAQRIAVELRRIESEVRRLLDDHDTKRKRKLAGTRRWNELEEDLIQWKFSGRVNEDVLRRLHSLVMQRHHLFYRLKFLAGTRPTWNT